MKWLFPKYIWNFDRNKPIIYLTFDDGPIPIVTEFVLKTLNEHQIKATFFCIGKNIMENPQIFDQVLSNGHSVGNHTMHHLNGWKTDNERYINDFVDFNHIFFKQNIFRPPYGRITRKQAKKIAESHKIIMWDIISGDFQPDLSEKDCLEICIKHTENGSIIVFHDSLKAYEKLRFVLPKYIAYFKDKGFSFEAIH